MTGLGSATGFDVLLAGGALVATLAIGTAIHEAAHATVLRAFGVRCTIEWFPDRGCDDGIRAGFFGRWAIATPLAIPRTFPPWKLRLSSVAPLAMATPMLLILVGVLPDPISSGNPALVGVTIAWFACALPSPQDFSLCWYADRAIAAQAESSTRSYPD